MDEEEWMQEAGDEEPKKQMQNEFMVAYNDTTAPSSSSKKYRGVLEILKEILNDATSKPKPVDYSDFQQPRRFRNENNLTDKQIIEMYERSKHFNNYLWDDFKSYYEDNPEVPYNARYRTMKEYDEDRILEDFFNAEVPPYHGSIPGLKSIRFHVGGPNVLYGGKNKELTEEDIRRAYLNHIWEIYRKYDTTKYPRNIKVKEPFFLYDEKIKKRSQ